MFKLHAIAPVETGPDETEDRVLTVGEVNKNEPLYEIAYSEAKSAFERQQRDLANVRDRAVGYLSFVGAATAFLAAADLQVTQRHADFYALAISASVVSAIVLVLATVLLSPWTTPIDEVDPSALVKTWIERDLPAPSRANVLRNLAREYSRSHAKNQAVIDLVHRLYLSIILVGGIQVILWAAVAWKAT
jgi:hypothetical protein